MTIRPALLLIASCVSLLWAPAGVLPAQAMCGGNIFLTCPPSASTAKPRQRTIREPRRRHRMQKPAAVRK